MNTKAYFNFCEMTLFVCQESAEDQHCFLCVMCCRVLRAGFNGYSGVREGIAWFKKRVSLKELRNAYPFFRDV